MHWRLIQRNEAGGFIKGHISRKKRKMKSISTQTKIQHIKSLRILIFTMHTLRETKGQVLMHTREFLNKNYEQLPIQKKDLEEKIISGTEIRSMILRFQSIYMKSVLFIKYRSMMILWFIS